MLQSKCYRPEMVGFEPPGKQYLHVVGTDLIRDADGRVPGPGGQRPDAVGRQLRAGKPRGDEEGLPAAVPAHAGSAASRTIRSGCARRWPRSRPPAAGDSPCVVLLSPGPYNSAYFEHSFLARHMGIELVLGPDLFVHDDRVFLKTTRGPQRVDVIYRRLDDDFLDPNAFRPDSLLGVPDLMKAYRAGNVTLANAVGTGVADDKAIYPFVEDMIRFYLSEEPILHNVPTYICARPNDRAYVLDHLDELVVKAVNESGGYGMLMGPSSTEAQRERVPRRRSWPTRATTSPSRSSRSRPARPGPRRGPPRGTSTSGPTSSAAPRPGSCPAA